MAYYGIDLHCDTMTVFKMTFKGEQSVEEKSTVKLKGLAFEYFMSNLNKQDAILVEASTISYWFYDQVSDKVKACHILNSNKISGVSVKTDKRDAKRLAHILVHYEVVDPKSKDKPYIYVPPREVRALRDLFTNYQLNKKMQTQTKNRIHSIFKLNGICLKKNALNSKIQRDGLLENDLPYLEGPQVASDLNILETLIAEQNGTRDLIYAYSYRLFPKEMTLLLSIKGFSPLTAAALMADAVRVDRFETSKKYCNYLRCAPRVQASNKTKHEKGTTKAGRRLAVSILTQSMNHLVKSSGYMTAFRDRLKKRKGKKYGKVRMAVIRKILTCTYHMLKKGKLYYSVERDKYRRKIRDLQRVVAKYKNCDFGLEKAS